MSVCRRLAMVSALAALAAAAVHLVAVRTAWGQDLDDRALVGRAVEPDAVVERFTDVLRPVSAGMLTLGGLALVALALARRRLALALGAAVVVAGANLTSQALKGNLPRPELGAFPRLTPSWPSGHATVAMSLLLAALIVLPPAMRWAVAGGGLLVVSAIGVAVVAAGWHRPSDAVGAFLVCLCWAAAAAAVLARRGEEVAARPAAVRAVAAGAGGLLALGGLVGVVGGVGWLADPSALAGRAARVDLVSYFRLSGALIAASGLVVVWALLHPLRGMDLAGRHPS